MKVNNNNMNLFEKQNGAFYEYINNDIIDRQEYLKSQAKSQAEKIFNYEKDSKNNPFCIIPIFRTSPPMIPNSGFSCRYTNFEWESAVEKELNLIKDKYFLAIKLNNMLSMCKNDKPCNCSLCKCTLTFRSNNN